MWDEILAALWFFAPAGLANMTPVLVAKLPVLHKWKTPVDMGKTYRGKRLLGDNKTIRGFVFGFLVALAMLFYQRWTIENGGWSDELSWIDYSSVNILALALAFSLGALGGDAVESFFKRQLDKQPGESWFPFDQLDYIVGGLLLSLIIVDLDIGQILTVIIVWAIIHPVSTVVGWAVGLKDKPI